MQVDALCHKTDQENLSECVSQSGEGGIILK